MKIMMFREARIKRLDRRIYSNREELQRITQCMFEYAEMGGTTLQKMLDDEKIFRILAQERCRVQARIAMELTERKRFFG